jgi:hypothetical protein
MDGMKEIEQVFGAATAESQVNVGNPDRAKGPRAEFRRFLHPFGLQGR